MKELEYDSLVQIMVEELENQSKDIISYSKLIVERFKKENEFEKEYLQNFMKVGG